MSGGTGSGRRRGIMAGMRLTGWCHASLSGPTPRRSAGSSPMIRSGGVCRKCASFPAKRWTRPDCVAGAGRPRDTPQVDTAYLWDGDQLAAEAPLHLGGRIDWARAVKWHFADEGGFTPIAKELPDGALLHIVSDHLGTPKEMFDAKGELVWAADHHVWGAVRTVRPTALWRSSPATTRSTPSSTAPCASPAIRRLRDRPLLQPPAPLRSADRTVCKSSPIGLAGADRPQGYVSNPAAWVDELGLSASLGKPFSGDVFRYENPARVSTTWDAHPGNIAASHRYSGQAKAVSTDRCRTQLH